MKLGFINLTKTKNGEGRQIPINETLRETLKGLTRRLNVPYVFHVYDEEKLEGKRFGSIKRSFITA